MRNKRRVIACLNIDVLGDNFECEASQTNIEQTAENTKRIVFIFSRRSLRIQLRGGKKKKNFRWDAIVKQLACTLAFSAAGSICSFIGIII